MEEKMDDIFNYSGAIDRTQMQKSISNIGLKHIEINNDKDLEKYSKNNTISEIRRKKSKISKKDHHKFKKIKLLNDDDDIEIYDEEINEKKKNKSSKKDDIDISKLIEEKKKNNSLNTSNIQLSQDLDKKFIETKREIQSMKQLIKSQSLDLTEESVPQRKNTTRNTKKRTLDIVEEEEESFDYEQYKGDISLTIKHPSDFDYTEKYDININSSFKKIFEIYQEKYRILKDEVKFKYDGMVVKSEKKTKGLCHEIRRYNHCPFYSYQSQRLRSSQTRQPKRRRRWRQNQLGFQL
eukprot:TRINITY_DN5585_c0_g1_i1.p1 TRINITY_DN5585_c0_g1~~TRINITY_DN5585_c0_g1_i1.p1  ORF type:complete len:294 (-),score=62.77 TRINITY_DN5585_c0_g1_i1:278-1159(-)